MARADGELPHLRPQGPTEYDVKYQTVLSENGDHLRSAATRPGAAARRGEREKIRKYVDHGINERGDGIKMYPLVIENGGRMGQEFQAYLRLLANAAESNHWGPKHRFWFTEAPKINAIHILGQYRKAVAVKKKIMTAHDNRYAAQL